MDHTNIALMDGQHRQCSESLQRPAEALRSETDSATIARSLGHLSDLIEAHFASEEALMRSDAYQLQTGHAADHDRGRILIQNLPRACKRGAMPRSEPSRICTNGWKVTFATGTHGSALI